MTDADIAAHAETGARLIRAVGSVVLGQERAIREALGALIARGHVLLEGVPGTAKTLLVRALSESLSLGFRRIQFTPDLMPSDVTGVSILGADGQFTFRPGPLLVTWSSPTRSTVRPPRPRRRCSRRCRSAESRWMACRMN
jgi:MoxR-like ATPase